jgi:hypothetical protein
MLCAMGKCGESVRRIGFNRHIWEHPCERLECHEGECDTYPMITVICCYCAGEVTVPDEKHSEDFHTGCAGYPYCGCAVAHKGDCL